MVLARCQKCMAAGCRDDIHRDADCVHNHQHEDFDDENWDENPGPFFDAADAPFDDADFDYASLEKDLTELEREEPAVGAAADQLNAIQRDIIAQGCPRCGSPDPKRHSAVQFEGEVQPCSHPFHAMRRERSTIASHGMFLWHPAWGRCNCANEGEHKRRVTECETYATELASIDQYLIGDDRLYRMFGVKLSRARLIAAIVTSLKEIEDEKDRYKAGLQAVAPFTEEQVAKFPGWILHIVRGTLNDEQGEVKT